MRIGLFGGTFNPVHLGHLRAAVEVKEDFGLDDIFLIPAALPPHKMPSEVAAASDRLRMLDRAIENVSGLLLSDVELNRSGPSYTINTVQHFKQDLLPDSQIYLIMGTDAFLEIHTWKSYEVLLSQIPIIVIPRPVADIQTGVAWTGTVKEYIRTKISKEYEFSGRQSCFLRAKKPPIFVRTTTSMEISATMIRNLVKNGRSIDFLVPQKVVEFIKSEGLYL
jgi:nicotinate-nucleotide adenylyltransferase